MKPAQRDPQTTESYDPAHALMLVRSGRLNARSAVYYWRNTAGALAQSWQRFDLLSAGHHELRRALLGIDLPSAWCGDRNARIRRFFEHVRTLPKPRLP
jgi:hypothetical protein